MPIETIERVIGRYVGRSKQVVRWQHEGMVPIALLVSASLLGACARESIGPPERTLPDKVDAAWVTPDLARSLRADGSIALPPPVLGPGEIGETQARALARLWARDFLPMILPALAKHRRAPVSPSLAVCGPAYFSQSVYEPIADTSVAIFVRRHFGSHWLLVLCGPDGDPQITLSVAALDADLEIVNDTIRFPVVQGESFFALPIPVGDTISFLSAERAIALTFSMTHVRISAPPLLVQQSFQTPAQSSRWLVQLEHPIAMSTLVPGAANERVDRLYVGRGARSTVDAFVAGADSGSARSVVVPHINSQDASHVERSAVLLRRRSHIDDAVIRLSPK